jgi:hypothetical protein
MSDCFLSSQPNTLGRKSRSRARCVSQGTSAQSERAARGSRGKVVLWSRADSVTAELGRDKAKCRRKDLRNRVQRKEKGSRVRGVFYSQAGAQQRSKMSRGMRRGGGILQKTYIHVEPTCLVKSNQPCSTPVMARWSPHHLVGRHRSFWKRHGERISRLSGHSRHNLAAGSALFPISGGGLTRPRPAQDSSP